MKAGVAFAAGACAALIAIGAVSAGRATFPGANGKIVFVRSATGLRGELWTLNADGRGRKRIWRARRRQYAVSPTWSPNSAEIAFTIMRLRANRRPISAAIWITGGGRLRRLTTPPARSLDLQPAWSPDGTKVAFIRIATGCRADCGTIWVVGADGSGAHAVATRAYVSEPAWSPDGTRIAFVYRPDPSAPFEIATVSASGSGLKPIAFTHRVNLDPTWSPDGSRLAYTADGSIFVVGADGSNEREVAGRLAGAVDIFPAWSAQGTIAFLSRHGSGTKRSFVVYLAHPDSDVIRGVGRLSGRPLSHPVWSPDGQKIVLSAGSRSAELVLIDLGGGVRRLGKGLDPDWQALR